MDGRKVVQVHRVIGPPNSTWQSMLLTTVVCEDGTMWEMWNDGAWSQVPPIPSEKADASVEVVHAPVG